MPNDPLLQRLSDLSWPQPKMDRPQVEPGQLWRAAWQDVACLVVILEVPVGRQVSVAAASEAGSGDETAVVASTDAGLSSLLWGSVTASIKVFTLEYRLADLSGESLAAVINTMHGENPNAWARISSPLDDRALVKADLLAAVEYLARAEWVPRAAGMALSEQAKRSGLGVAEVSSALEIPAGDARALLQGKRAPRTTELGALSELFGEVYMEAVSYDADLVAFMDLPEYRERLERRGASRRMTDPVALRRSFAEDLMPVAARMRSQPKRDWRTLMEEVLRAD